jgi:hypothetical protein
MADGERSLELLKTRDSWGGETVWLERRGNGDLSLIAYTTGRAVELIMGDGMDEYTRTWTVAAEHVPSVLHTAVRQLFPDTSALASWLGQRGIAATTGEWGGYGVRPAAETRVLLEALRDVIGTEANDEGTTIANRFIGWLTARNIPYRLGEQVAHDI